MGPSCYIEIAGGVKENNTNTDVCSQGRKIGRIDIKAARPDPTTTRRK